MGRDPRRRWRPQVCVRVKHPPPLCLLERVRHALMLNGLRGCFYLERDGAGLLLTLRRPGSRKRTLWVLSRGGFSVSDQGDILRILEGV